MEAELSGQQASSFSPSLAEQGFAGDGEQRPLVPRSRSSPRLKPSVDMICIATTCAKKASQPQLLAQALSKSSDFSICTQGKS
jgi:hypothetical protein